MATFKGPGARPKTDWRTSMRPTEGSEVLEQQILRGLCNYGGSLSLTALREALIDDGKIRANASDDNLRRFLTNSPHKVFHLDDDPVRNECTVRAQTDAVLCQTYNPRRDTCQRGAHCIDFHLCRHFVSDKCKKGRKCGWPHQLRNGHNEEILHQNGLAHLAEEDIMQILRQSWIDITVPDVCKHYNSRGGCNKTDCHFLHVCRHYVLGDCRYSRVGGTRVCSYSHDIRDAQPMRVWARYHIDAQTKNPTELLGILREKKRQESISIDSQDEDDDDDDDGEDDYDDEEEEEERKTTVPAVCIHYNGKGCNKGDKCSFLHICSYFSAGTCRFGEGCRLSHNIKSRQPMAVWRKSHIDAQSMNGQELLELIRKKKSQEKETHDNVGLGKKKSLPGAAEDTQDKKEICEYNLRGKCHYGDSCRKLHSEHHYLWQYSNKDGQTWINFDALNVQLEKAFCDIRNPGVEVQSSCKTYIDFETMKWTGTSGQGQFSVDIRRLKTPPIKMSEVKGWQQVVSTSWQWFFLDKGDIWVQYAKNDEIEDAYQKYLETGAGAREYEFKTKEFDYVLDFSTMQQKNKWIGTMRKVRRRPKFVTKEQIERSLKTIKARDMILPKTWDLHCAPADSQNNFVLCELDQKLQREEYRSVSQQFGEKMDKSAIFKIERVQNTELWEDFVRKRERMQDSKDDGTHKQEGELLLFHGTQKEVVNAICQQNFDNRLSGSRVGTKYGQGCYFSKSAKYSDCYASQDLKGRQRMFLARVLVGSFTAGHPSYLRPPLRPGSNLLLYDSCVDNPIDPLIFVIFDRSQVYPEYLITYKK